METFSVIVEGHCLEGFDAAVVQKRLSELMKISEDRAATLLAGQATRVKSGADAATGKRYLVALRASGVACRLDSEQLEFDEVQGSVPEPPEEAPARAASGFTASAETATTATTKTKSAMSLIWALGSGLLAMAAIYFFWHFAASFLDNSRSGAPFARRASNRGSVSSGRAQ